MLQAVSAVQDGSSPSSDPGVLDLAPPPSPVLRIIIDNMFYPVTLDVLQQVDHVIYIQEFNIFPEPFRRGKDKRSQLYIYDQRHPLKSPYWLNSNCDNDCVSAELYTRMLKIMFGKQSFKSSLTMFLCCSP